MKAVCWTGRNSVRVEDVPEPKILNSRDAIVRVTRAAICGSDLHLYDGYMPGMARGDILGHEFMGEVVEIGSGVSNLAVGDRVVVPFPISCGGCSACQSELFSLCENSNPNAWLAEKVLGYSPAGIYGYSHLLGGYAGGQAEYVRVPFADVGPLKLDDGGGDGLSDDALLMLSDVFPTGYMAAEMCGIDGGETIAVWGCGPVGQLAIKSAFLLGAGRVIAIDRFAERLRMAHDESGAESLDYTTTDVREELRELTAGRGPDACIDAVGMEAHGTGVLYAYDRAMHAMRIESDRPIALREAILACRNGGTVSVIGAYGGFVDKFPIGAVMNRSLTIRSGQAHAQRYLRPLLARMQAGEVDPSFIVTHRLPLDEAPRGYETFKNKQDECIKVVLTP